MNNLFPLSSLFLPFPLLVSVACAACVFMRRSASLWALRHSNMATIRCSEPAAKALGGLFFADRAVKMTCSNIPGCSFICTPKVLTCSCPAASAVVRLVTDETGRVPVANMRLGGKCAVSLFRSHRLVFHCAGDDEARVERHELNLKQGDVLAILGGYDLQRDWKSVDRTFQSVMHEDLEYITEEMLLKLGTGADSGSNNGCRCNGTCIMTVIQNKPSGLLPQPPSSMQCSVV